MIFVNSYAPNGMKDREKYFEQLNTKIREISGHHDADKIICGGDYNCILNSKDCNKGQRRLKDGSLADVSVRAILEVIHRFNLSDVWQTLNPEKHQYTWRQIDSKNEDRNVSKRLDRFLVSESLLENVDRCNILPCHLSDHLPVVLRCKLLNKVPRGKGVWKFNNDLLKSSNFVHETKEFWAGWKQRKPVLANLGE